MSYKCEIIADSLNPQGDRIVSMLVTYPRIIHAEMLRHRVLSRNVASSRAIPFKKMVKDVEENPFIPIAWQFDHKGMQGTKYVTEESDFGGIRARKESWLIARNKALEMAKDIYSIDTTKQLCNRLLEPFVWTTELITATEWNNFFELRCPKYEYYDMVTGNQEFFKSKKDWLNYYKSKPLPKAKHIDKVPETTLDCLQINQSGAEIHIQKIAEMIWDAYRAGTPKQLEAGEWHMPFGDSIPASATNENWTIETLIKIATARCARLSYYTLGADPKIDYAADISLHDKLLDQKHMSPFEHCARAMSDLEYYQFTKGNFATSTKSQYSSVTKGDIGMINIRASENHSAFGWCNNFKGFVQYRYEVENKKFV